MDNSNFDGVFRFTNPTTEDFAFLWNNKEYTFPAERTVPMIIANESLENIQEIRKKAAYKLAVREFYKGKEYTKMSKMGNGLPPTFDEKVLEPMIEQCLKPLPISRATVKEGSKDSDRNYRASKAFDDKAGLGTVNEAFKDAPIHAVGKMPDSI